MEVKNVITVQFLLGFSLQTSPCASLFALNYIFLLSVYLSTLQRNLVKVKLQNAKELFGRFFSMGWA